MFDHSGHRVGAVDGRGAAGQHFHPLHSRRRDHRQVDDVAGDVAGGLGQDRDTPSVEQHQRVAWPEPAKIERLRVGVEVVGVLLADEHACVHAQVRERVVQRGKALACQVLCGEHLDRIDRFRLRALDARAGDFHLLQCRCVGLPGGGRLRVALIRVGLRLLGGRSAAGQCQRDGEGERVPNA